MNAHVHTFPSDSPRFRWADRATPSPWAKARTVELRYARVLRAVAKQIGAIVTGFGDPIDNPTELGWIDDALARYAELLKPWARSAAGRVIAEVDRQDLTTWMRHSRAISRGLREEVSTAPTGEALRAALSEQVRLITSLPTEAAERVHKLATEAVTGGSRGEELRAMIMRTGAVTESRATLIARTEVARVGSVLTQVRAEHIGSTGYLWRTTRDSDVRKSHREMEGRFVDWAKPPTLSDGTTTHAGQIYSCRCFAEPIIPDID